MASAGCFEERQAMVAALSQTACRLCMSDVVREFWRDDRREYLRCDVCGLVFVPSRHFLSADAEKRRYDLHRNDPADGGYRRFLLRLFTPLHQCLAPASVGLDFGSGPEPLLSRMFAEAGHAMKRFDRFYEPSPAVLEQRYDFITASEVVEHLQEPARELDRLWGCLKPGGRLGIMTQPVVERNAFPQWHYKNDLTHVCFFSPLTFAWLADRWKAELTFPEKDVALFRKREAVSGNGPKSLTG
jgi:hypothetical protein